MDYQIMMDVSGDILPEIAKQNDLDFIPMDYSIGDEMRTCTGPEDAATIHAFYEGQRHGDLTHTSQISPYMYEQHLKKYLEAGISVLYLCLSSGLSSTFQSACTAKEELKEKYPDADFFPVDTLAATGGMGVLAERAIRNRRAGMTIKENYEDLVKAASKIKHFFMVEDLMYLKRGGRVSAATAVVGTALGIKPILIINKEGKLDNVNKKRGTKAACSCLVEEFKNGFADTGDVVYVIDADDAEKGEHLAAEVKALFPRAVVRRSSLSPIIGAHTGPGMAAICFMER